MPRWMPPYKTEKRPWRKRDYKLESIPMKTNMRPLSIDGHSFPPAQEAELLITIRPLVSLTRLVSPAPTCYLRNPSTFSCVSMFIHPSNYNPFTVSYLGLNISHPLSIFIGRYHPLSIHPLRCIIFPRNVYKMVLWVWRLANLTTRHMSRNDRTSKRGQPAFTCSRTPRARDIAEIFKILFGN
jgi:hypothetical protein